MKIVVVLLLYCFTETSSLFPVIRRGNLFQQLSFLTGVPIHEQFYLLIMRVLYNSES